MKLRYFPANAAWAFVFLGTPCKMADFPLFFSSRREAVAAAKYRGLMVSRSGDVTAA